MKRIFKCGIASTIVAVASFVAYHTYVSYGYKDNSLLMQNIEALAQIPDSGDDNYSDEESGSGKFVNVKCYVFEANKGDKQIICPEGSSSKVWIECPNEKKKADVDSITGYCLREL